MIRDANLRVQAATEEQQQIKRDRQRRNGTRRPRTNGKLLSLDVIRDKYGEEAADIAAGRRKHSI